MDFYAECEKRKNGRLGKIGELTYRRYRAAKQVEAAQREIEALDLEIAAHDEALSELDRSQRNFNSYLAVKEGALTTEQLAQAIEEGRDLKTETAKAAVPAPGPAPEPAQQQKKEASDA